MSWPRNNNTAFGAIIPWFESGWFDVQNVPKVHNVKDNRKINQHLCVLTKYIICLCTLRQKASNTSGKYIVACAVNKQRHLGFNAKYDSSTNSKAADLKFIIYPKEKKPRQLNRLLRVFPNDTFSNLHSLTKSNLTQPCLNKEHGIAQREQNNLNLYEWMNITLLLCQKFSLAYCKH